MLITTRSRLRSSARTPSSIAEPWNSSLSQNFAPVRRSRGKPNNLVTDGLTSRISPDSASATTMRSEEQTSELHSSPTHRSSDLLALPELCARQAVARETKQPGDGWITLEDFARFGIGDDDEIGRANV